MEICDRCSKCKYTHIEQIKSWRFSYNCPAAYRYHFHIYSAGGKGNLALAMIDDRITEITDNALDMIYRCNMCGSCEVGCKYVRDKETFEVLQQLRITCIENGFLHPALMPVIDGLRKEDNMVLGLKADRGNWAKGLNVKDITKEKADVYFHVGCRYSFDEELWNIPRDSIQLLQKAGVDVGIAGKDEACCGGHAYEIGYEGETIKYAEHNLELVKAAGAKTLVTSCADGYFTFKVLYDKLGKKLPVEVLHITQYLARLIEEGKLKPTKSLPMTVTYHDPCNLGRKGEPWIHWEGKFQKAGTEDAKFVPPREFRRGTYGVYEPPRDVIKSIPGLSLVEMERIKEYAWCCGAGGSVRDLEPDMAMGTALERIAEAEGTGAEAIVTACGWCKRNLTDAINQNGSNLKVYDVVELLKETI